MDNEVYYLLVTETEINDENNIVLDIEDIQILFEVVKHNKEVREWWDKSAYYLIIKDLINDEISYDGEICACNLLNSGFYGFYDISINDRSIIYTESPDQMHLLIKNKVNLTIHSRKTKELQIQIKQLKDTYYKTLGSLYVDNDNDDKGYVLK